MMRLEWDNSGADIGYHELTLYKDDGTKLTISLRDYTTPWQQECRAKDPVLFDHYHPHPFELDFVHGFSKQWGLGAKFTLEEAKKVAELYLLDFCINEYEEVMKKLDNLKLNAEQAVSLKTKIQEEN